MSGTGFFGDVEPIRYEGPKSDNPLAFAITTRTGAFSASAWRTTCAPRSATGTISSATASTRSAARPSAALVRRRHGAARRAQGRRRLRDVRHPRLPVLHLPRPRHRAGRRLARAIEPQRARDRRCVRAPRCRRAGAACCGAPPTCSRTAATWRARRPIPTRTCSPTPAAQVKNAIDVDPPARRRQLRAVGRPRRLRDAAQHRPEARTGPARPLPSAWWSSTSTRSASRARS